MTTRRGLLFACLAVLLALPADAAQTMRLEDRVAAEAAIQRVYHRHRIGETRSFEAAVPMSTIEQHVRSYTAQAAALESLTHTATTAEQLDGELARIVQNTRMPDRLDELFAALERDPVAINECLVRPVLTERRLREFWGRDAALRTDSDPTFDDWWSHAEASYAVSELGVVGSDATGPVFIDNVAAPSATDSPADAWNNASLDDYYEGSGPCLWTGTEVMIFGGDAGTRYNMSTDRWSPISAGNTLSSRFGFVSVWTGSEMIIWGGSTGGFLPSLADGARFNPATGAWTRIYGPYAASNASAVWTGTQMIVFGGNLNPSDPTNAGARYNPSTDTWASLPAAAAKRSGHAAVWTGSQMIVWGGYGGAMSGYLSSEAIYAPATNTWSVISNSGAPTGSGNDTAVWTGAEMLVWSLNGAGQGRYNPATNTWAPISTTGAPPHRQSQAVAWSGSQMMVWGGCNNSSICFNDGARYDPVTNSWSPVTAVGAPGPGRYFSTRTGNRIFVYGGVLVGGGLYDSDTDVWTPISIQQPTSSAGRVDHASVWTGSEMVVWGGSATESSDPIDSRPFRYNPALDSWSAGPYAGAPAPFGTASVWSGTEMLVWDTRGVVGAAYDPSSDTWRTMATANAPSSRDGAVVRWAAGRMLVWGGVSSSVYLATGARYDPSTNLWTPMATVGAPSARSIALSVWSGNRLLVWGGRDASVYLGTGARYDPATDSWGQLSAVGAPTPRSLATAVWTGSRMVVWGGSQDGNESNTVTSGGRYDPATDTWSPTTSAGAPYGRNYHTATWADGVMFVFGGYSQSQGVMKSGGRYDPVADSWTTIAWQNGPRSRSSHSAVWTGSQMIVWGGTYAGRTGGIYGTPGVCSHLNCDDGNPCTVDSCTQTMGCRHIAGNPGAVCRAAAGVCDVAETCDGANNNCPTDGFLGDGATCDDWSVCRTNGTCHGSLCLGGATLNCDDGNPCTVDSCNPSGGCLHNPGNLGTVCRAAAGACDVAETCDGANNICPTDGFLVVGAFCRLPTSPCDAAEQCSGTSGTCPADGFEPTGTGCGSSFDTDCDNPDTCDGVGACLPNNESPGAPCTNDGNQCTNDLCIAGGTCSHQPKPSGTACDLGSLCTTGDTCQNGTCVGGSTADRPDPKSVGYYKKLCKGPYKGDSLTPADVSCVNDVPNFVDVMSIADLCDVLSDKRDRSRDSQHDSACAKAESELMACALNRCRARTCDEAAIDPDHGGDCRNSTSSTVGQSFFEASFLILDPDTRTKDQCKFSTCLSHEINDGKAFKIHRVKGDRSASFGITLSWNAPYYDGPEAPHVTRYQVWRRALQHATSAPEQIWEGYATTMTDDTPGDFEYEIRYFENDSGPALP